MTGLGHASIASITAMAVGWRGGLPNSVMSAPATKVRPAQAITTAEMSGWPAARDTRSRSPTRTSCFMALTGGLSMVMTATPLSVRMLTSSDMPGAPLFWPMPNLAVRPENCISCAVEP